METYKVYVLANAKGCIFAVQSSAHLTNTNGWTYVATGTGDKYAHAQQQFFPLPLTDDDGVYRYKLVGGKPAERTEDEMDADRAAMPETGGSVESTPSVDSDTAQRIAELERIVASQDQQIAMLLEGVTADG